MMRAVLYQKIVSLIIVLNYC